MTIPEIENALADARRAAELARAELGPPPPEVVPRAVDPARVDLVDLTRTAILQGVLPLHAVREPLFALPSCVVSMVRALAVRHHKQRGHAARLIAAELVDALGRKHGVAVPPDTVAEIGRAGAIRQTRLQESHARAVDRLRAADAEVARLEEALRIARAREVAKEAAEARSASEADEAARERDERRKARHEANVTAAVAAVGLTESATPKRIKKSV